MTDRLAEIRATLSTGRPMIESEDAAWLCDEVERLRTHPDEEWRAQEWQVCAERDAAIARAEQAEQAVTKVLEARDAAVDAASKHLASMAGCMADEREATRRAEAQVAMLREALIWCIREGGIQDLDGWERICRPALATPSPAADELLRIAQAAREAKCCEVCGQRCDCTDGAHDS